MTEKIRSSTTFLLHFMERMENCKS